MASQKHKSCIIHDWSEWSVHKLHLYSSTVGKRYVVQIHEKVCKKCFKLKAKLKKK